MHAVLGALLLAVTVVLFQFAYIHHRKPVPSRWTRYELVSQLFCIVILATLTGGVGYLADFFLSFATESFTWSDAGLLVAIVAVTAIPVAAMRRQWRRLQAEAASGQSTVHELRPAEGGPDSGLPPGSGTGAGKRHRAA